MRELFVRYIIGLYSDVPASVYEGLLSVFCFGAMVLITINGLRKGLRLSAGLFVIEYVLLIYCATVIFRDFSEDAGHDFSPLWSYKAIGKSATGTVLALNERRVFKNSPFLNHADIGREEQQFNGKTLQSYDKDVCDAFWTVRS